MEELPQKVVVGCICERLGNIMFQIGAYLTYAKRYNRALFLAINEYDKRKLKEYRNYFELLDRFKFLDIKELHHKYKNIGFYAETPKFDYEPIPDASNDIVSLVGYWQNEDYFDKDLVKEFFRPSEEYKNLILEKYGDLSEATSISVRHGDDYVKQQDFFVVPSAKWYEDAYNTYFPGTKVIITSDDIEWAKENIHIKDAIFVEEGDKVNVFWDLFTCSLCKNHITYPGTYGWMGAWLGEGEDSKVICPDKWWGPKNQGISENIVPKRWLRFKL